MKTGILYFTTCFHGFGILRHVDPFVRMLHIYNSMQYVNQTMLSFVMGLTSQFHIYQTLHHYQSQGTQLLIIACTDYHTGTCMHTILLL